MRERNIVTCCSTDRHLALSGAGFIKDAKSRRHRHGLLSTYLAKIARLGGYLGRAKDRPPGNVVMWRGLSRLTDIELGFALATRVVGN
ncbi:MAG: hypothetical protein JOY54_12210 [Acidobacteriaceae bacterium]|nr:hypothetical protein [Acidobacteriaceae bacterium]